MTSEGPEALAPHWKSLSAEQQGREGGVKEEPGSLGDVEVSGGARHDASEEPTARAAEGDPVAEGDRFLVRNDRQSEGCVHQEQPILKIKPEGEEARLEGIFSAEQQGREGGVKEEPDAVIEGDHFFIKEIKVFHLESSGIGEPHCDSDHHSEEAKNEIGSVWISEQSTELKSKIDTYKQADGSELQNWNHNDEADPNFAYQELCEGFPQGATSRRPHSTTHADKMPFRCEVCVKSFSRLETLRRHERIHSGEKPYQCDICMKSFSQSGNLQIHKRIHSGERLYKCDTCMKTFCRLGHLQEHERVHTGEKLFKCEICMKTFSQSGHLYEHRRTHTGEKIFKCDICMKNFSQSGHLQQHKRIHTGVKQFKCEICIKTFSRSGDLRRHKRIHAGEKPFECEICKKSFSDAGSLRRHERIHAGMKS